ncbi:ParB/RepB/Spo0J family partition protein [Xylanivirga thermophila]|uniref:ParB/RepB/Spo0J family partition protein n=1 Tax=Xylanivirga thermophila TaxID=2496273 RepID=UPI001FB46E30|nr:ParB/RepB/Spo0J family partition protein [Xylanivirga thermophila]
MTKKPTIVNLNDLLGIEDDQIKETEDNTGIKEVELSQLVPFKNHPFKLYEGDRLDDMVESIKEHGIILPLIVRPTEHGKYEILSGHNRANAGKIAGLIKAPVVIKEDLTNEEAMLIVTETNLIQRAFSELNHSEKARILTERHNAIKEQGKRMDLINEVENLCKADDLAENSDVGKVCPQGRTRDIVADKYDLSPRMVTYYLRIDTLTNELKERLDNDEIPFMAGVDLSFLQQVEQDIVEDILETYGFKITLKKSNALKEVSQKKGLDYEKIYDIVSGKFFDKPKKPKNFKFTAKFKKKLSKYFDKNQSQTEIESIIEQALETYFSQDREVDNEIEM